MLAADLEHQNSPVIMNFVQGFYKEMIWEYMINHMQNWEFAETVGSNVQGQK